MLRTDDPRSVLTGFKPGEYELKATRQKRSLTANNYAWLLINKIAEKMKLPPIEVYKNEIQNIYGIYDQLYMPYRALDNFREAFCKDHIGRFVECISVDNDGGAEVLITYGSSDFDRAHMAHFIDNIVQECETLEIETRPAEEIQSLLEAMPDW